MFAMLEQEKSEALARMYKVGHELGQLNPPLAALIDFANGVVRQLDSDARHHARTNSECDIVYLILVANVANAVTKTIEDCG